MHSQFETVFCGVVNNHFYYTGSNRVILEHSNSLSCVLQLLQTFLVPSTCVYCSSMIIKNVYELRHVEIYMGPNRTKNYDHSSFSLSLNNCKYMLLLLPPLGSALTIKPKTRKTNTYCH